MRRTRSLPTRMPRATSSFHILGQPYSCLRISAIVDGCHGVIVDAISG
jgi:hypothetical protein